MSQPQAQEHSWSQQLPQVSGIRIGVTSLKALQFELGFESRGDQKLFAALICLIQGCPGCAEDEALNIISMSLGRIGCNKAAGAAELVDLDDGPELFTPEDKKHFEDEQRRQRGIMRTAFRLCWWT